MFEAAELGIEVGKKQWEERSPKAREDLLQAQRDLAGSKHSCVILVSGVEGAGKRETVNLLLEWMDARGIQTHVMQEATDEELARPPYYRFWRRLPPSGRTGIFLGSWYSAPIVQRTFGDIKDKDLDVQLDRMIEFERMLAHEKVIVIKLWMHISKKLQKKRLKHIEKNESWRLGPLDWKFFKRYDEFRAVSEHALRRTSIGEAPWHIVEASDERHRALSVVKIVTDAIRDRLAEPAAPKRSPGKVMPLRKPQEKTLLSALDLSLTVDKEKYEKKLPELQGKLNRLVRKLPKRNRSLILVFEGPDAAGKGGAIRRVSQAMDAGAYDVTSIAAPTDEERAHPYLWRFWRALPRAGKVTIYDRSWYGRVLVERIEGFCGPEDWQRAYSEINAFEEQLHEAGAIILKFWMQISQEEQLRRFKDRQVTPYKQYKITEEDWRNRDKWDAYGEAACEVFEKNSTKLAPWVLVEANDKNHARLKVLRTVTDALEEELGG
ncbi:MAG TPA: polyphosphate:AMP phosphotransferase [Myxococcales bacterium]|nr:polyphosphate:AMP phosphotransferase [Myxococcales bacterium]